MLRVAYLFIVAELALSPRALALLSCSQRLAYSFGPQQAASCWVRSAGAAERSGGGLWQRLKLLAVAVASVLLVLVVNVVVLVVGAEGW